MPLRVVLVFPSGTNNFGPVRCCIIDPPFIVICLSQLSNHIIASKFMPIYVITATHAYDVMV